MSHPEYWGYTPAISQNPADKWLNSFREDESVDQEHEPIDQEHETPVKSKGSLLQSRIIASIRSTLSSVHNSTSEHTMQLIKRIESSTKVMNALPKEYRETITVVMEVILHEASVLSTGTLDLADLPVLSEYTDEISKEIKEIHSQFGASTPRDPHAFWQDIVETVQRAHTRYAALDLAEGISQKDSVKTLMEKFRKIEPPTSVKALSRVRTAKTAKEVSETERAVRSGKTPYRFSSGMPTLDLGYTGSDEEKGFISPGNFVVVMGPTGTGKSSFANSIVPAIQMDLKNWGLTDAMQVLFHTEEESIDKLKGFRMNIGQKYHHYADNLVIDACGTSRRRLAETLYDLVIRADNMARASKRPIVEYLPHVVQIDYIQSIQEPGDKDPATASAITAEFFLRGVCAWNHEEMFKFSGVDFREYAGMAWPKGMEHHRVAVVAYAQLVKVDDSTLYYQKNRRGTQLGDYALLGDTDEPLWDVKEGDLRLFGKNQMRGSGIIAQNAHAIIILHRSVPYNNPAVVGEDGVTHLADTRARILFDKSRSGSRMVYAPLRFDVQVNGNRAQYFDEVAEKAILAGKLKNIDKSYQEPGDPMLPVRPHRDKLGEATY